MNKHIKLLMFFIISLVLIACSETVDQSQNNENINTLNESSPSINNDDVTNDKIKNNVNLPELKVHYIDVGQADATLFEWSDEDASYTVLYDTGDWKRDDVVQYLKAQEIDTIDLIIISHPDADHIGQLANIINQFDVGEVWMSGNESSSQTFQKALNAILTHAIDYDEPRTGDVFDIGSLTIEVIHPSTISNKANEESISMVVTYGETKFLFTGDAGVREEKQMMNEKINIEADILQLGHHGSNTSSDLTFIKTVNPDIAIYSAGAGNSYGHPHEDVVERILNDDIILYGTDVNGTIIVTTNGNEYDVQTKVDGTISPKSSGSSQGKDIEHEEVKSTDCIDINNAPIDELQQIIHIGATRAEALIQNRPHKTIDGLTVINGIGPARIKEIKAQGLGCTGG